MCMDTGPNSWKSIRDFIYAVQQVPRCRLYVKLRSLAETSSYITSPSLLHRNSFIDPIFVSSVRHDKEVKDRKNKVKKEGASE